MNDIFINKKSGGNEIFNFDKLLASIGKTGVPLTGAIKICKNIEEWIKKQVKIKPVASSQIRDKVIKLLSKDFPAEAESYKVYKK